ncbi:MAG: hypothetical protein K2H02_01515 [Anaeroplasmataceae bacterium]|nr:hypothetical protein [Anaeroplasmataceae bacterium]
MEKELVLDVEESPKKKSQWLLFAIQHILAMLVACITVPLITGLPIGPTLVAAGVGTLIYIFTTKRKSPVFLSSSFAYLAPMSTALTLGIVDDGTMNYAAVMLGMLMVGIVYVIIALVIKKIGTKWLNKLLPPVVIGPIIMVIGLGLAASAIGNVTSGTAGIQIFNTSNAGGTLPWQYTIVSVIIALVACFLTAFCATSRKKNLTLIPFVIGMIGAYVLACIITGIGHLAHTDWLKIVDFSLFDKNWGKVDAWITTDFVFVKSFSQNAKFSLHTVGQVALLFIPVALVTICEHIGDHKNLGNIINRDLLDDEPGLTRTLIGDGVATAVSGVLCGAANTTYGENVAVIGVSKIASVSVIMLAAILSIVLGFFAPLTTLLQTIPACITGGVSLILYGFIASSGVKMLLKEKVDFGKTRNIVIASVILVAGIGGFALGFGGVLGNNIISISATSVAMILGIIMNLVLPKDKEEDTENHLAEEVAKEDFAE